MTSETITIARAELTDAASRTLIESLNAELRGRYPEPGATHFHLEAGEVADGRGTFLVAYRQGTPIGCGALRRIDAETAELKRMYVSPATRGNGLGRRLLAALEAEARADARRSTHDAGASDQRARALREPHEVDPGSPARGLADRHLV